MRVVLAASEVKTPGQTAERLVLARSLLAQEELAATARQPAVALKELLPAVLRSPTLAFLEPLWLTRATMAAAQVELAILRPVRAMALHSAAQAEAVLVAKVLETFFSHPLLVA